MAPKRLGDGQVQRLAGQKASEQVQEAMELATWAQKQLARASQQVPRPLVGRLAIGSLGFRGKRLLVAFVCGFPICRRSQGCRGAMAA